MTTGRMIAGTMPPAPQAPASPRVSLGGRGAGAGVGRP